ncbi:cobyric acid synthase CobQ [Geothermobacter hydrogeniphilus]|uniref:Cobyric acid synthase n=1 Tax=Geothermobacter hydrogeniphilus TaxID=1969733 RepID=A0A2K2H6J8_9BACT|nr:cobyric acid synthase [Geothermobacter hydrogeniphilus]PNU18843.1 cobyric acid synthase CobQ [Geothermobacter hydrogeniphilus]
MTNKLYIVGLGPGDSEHMTPAARAALERAEVVTGYNTYLELIPDLVAGKETFSTGMRQETERCREALRRAADGATVALVCSGDAGIYGMAGLVLELQQAEGPEQVEIEIVPGVSAVQAAAARLGAPLMHDFAVISLSDLLTDWSAIVRRLEAAAGTDFVIALYNPKSRGRAGQIEQARQILLRHRDPATPVGIVRNACREGEVVTVSDLASFTDETIDMFSLVIIGNPATFVDRRGRMVTPRGYRLRREARGGRSEETPVSGGGSPTPALFVAGTGSDVGKSVIAAGFCRLLARRGLTVAPFKAQNMANNSAVCADGGEIGRAQALQAAACRVEPTVDMNPVLLKPNSETGAQVIVQGRPVGNMSVREYHAFRENAWRAVCDSYRRLARQVGLVVMEGAGSIAEINLRGQDITNLAAARMAGAKVVLVADIDRGGVFAAILGTLQLLTEEERELIAGVVINKFRGDVGLLKSGIDEIECRTGVPVLGVIPWLRLQLPEEDSLALERPGDGFDSGIRIGVVQLPRISNFTDFAPFEAVAGVSLCYVERPEQIAGLDLLILPGTKSTLADLDWLRQQGLAEAILTYHAEGGRLIGICGGLQMLGERVRDPQGVEGPPGEAPGLGLLDIETTLQTEKQTHRVEAEFLPAAAAAGFTGFDRVRGYEIHAGASSRGILCRPLLRLVSRSGDDSARLDGAVSADGRVWGSYLHGLFDDQRVLHAVLAPLASGRSFPAGPSARQRLDSELDRLADHLAAHLDLKRLCRLCGLERIPVS